MPFDKVDDAAAIVASSSRAAPPDESQATNDMVIDEQKRITSPIPHPGPLRIDTSSVTTQDDIYTIIGTNVECPSAQQQLKNAVQSYAANWDAQYRALADVYDKLQMSQMDLQHDLVIQQTHYEKAVREMKFYKSKYEGLRQKRQTVLSPVSNAWEFDRKGDKPRRHMQRDTTYVSENNENCCGSSCNTSLTCSSGRSSINTVSTRFIEPISLDGESALSNDADEQFDLMAVLSVTDDDAPRTGHPSLSTEKAGLRSPPPSHPPPPPPLGLAPVESTQESQGSSSSSMDPSNKTNPLTHTRSMVLTYACGDGFWDTIARGKNNKAEVETLISSYLRRGGKPNVAKNSSSLKSVKEGYGLIHALIAVKNTTALIHVIEAGANPNAITLSPEESDRTPPLVLAAQIGYLNGVRALIERARADIFQRGPGQITALHAAIQSGDNDVVVYLLRASKFTLLDIVDVQGATPLHHACMHTKTSTISILVRDCHVKLDSRDNKGETPLHYAVRHRRMKIVNRLVGDYGAYPNHYVAKQTPTPLDLAKSGGLKAIYEYLRSTGAKTTKEMENTANRISTNTQSSTSGSRTNSAVSSVNSGAIATTPVTECHISSTISGSTATTAGSSTRSVISSGSASILSSNESAISRESDVNFTLSRASKSFRSTFFGS